MCSVNLYRLLSRIIKKLFIILRFKLFYIFANVQWSLNINKSVAIIVE